MGELYPPIEPLETGTLVTDDGNHVFWEVCGNPRGKPAVVLHGGPGSGCTPHWRRYFDPSAYRVVLLDQRGCGRSAPHAGDPSVGLETNTTQNLVADIELLRSRLGVERRLVLGGSWGSTLGLAYAEAHPESVSEMVLFSVVTTSRREVAWATRDVCRFFPEAWERFRDGVPPGDRDGDLVAAYRRLLNDADPTVRENAARSWCDWENAQLPSGRYDDPRFRMAFARLVTHYWHHAAFLEDGELIRRAGRLVKIPGVLIHGRLDVGAPLDIPVQVHRAWPGSELVVVDGAGHGLGERGIGDAVVAALDRFAG